MVHIALIILGVIGLCGAISLKGLSISILICVGIEIIGNIALNLMKRAGWGDKND